MHGKIPLTYVGGILGLLLLKHQIVRRLTQKFVCAITVCITDFGNSNSKNQ